jgi:hypothetical protein
MARGKAKAPARNGARERGPLHGQEGHLCGAAEFTLWLKRFRMELRRRGKAKGKATEGGVKRKRYRKSHRCQWQDVLSAASREAYLQRAEAKADDAGAEIVGWNVVWNANEMKHQLLVEMAVPGVDEARFLFVTIEDADDLTLPHRPPEFIRRAH